MASYKEVIGQRLSNQLPVITYQDNMQISRTSLRHLRLSKLQKEKIKQGKMWDFTVRGWREADITGIEHHFNEKEAVEAQKPVKKLVFKDTKIGKCFRFLGKLVYWGQLFNSQLAYNPGLM